jgi:hypothetical protein
MPGEPSTVGANRMLDAVNGRASATARNTFLALLTAAPNDATTMANMTEITTPGTNGYTRQQVTWSTPSGDPSASSNSAALTFGPFTSNLDNVTHVALVSAQTGTAGDFLWHWAVDEPKDPAIDDSITVAVGALVMTAD